VLFIYLDNEKADELLRDEIKSEKNTILIKEKKSKVDFNTSSKIEEKNPDTATVLVKQEQKIHFIDEFEAITEYNILHQRELIDEGEILSEINGDVSYELNDEILKKIELEIEGKAFQEIDEERILSEINGDNEIILDKELLNKIELEIKSSFSVSIN